MSLVFSSVAEPGRLSDERVVLKVTAKIELGRYAIFQCTAAPNGLVYGGNIPHAFWMAQHVERLAAARGRLVETRRTLAGELAKPFERGDTEKWQHFIDLQTTIEAIDRAIQDERYIAEKEKPFAIIGPLVGIRPRND
jgi:hypothetical protein